MAKQQDPLKQARARNLPHWFLAAYGVGRMISSPLSTRISDDISPTRDRVASLFDHTKPIIGTGFTDYFSEERSAKLNAILKRVFVDNGILPEIEDLQLRARGRIQRPGDLRESHKVTMRLNKGHVDVPTTGLSHGYQSTMAWVSDLIGQIWWEGRENEKELEPEEMEGICLVDEIDLHLHPRWQAKLIPALKKTFPKIQFIATTHSPMILPGLEQDEIILLDQDEEGNVITKPAPEPPKLMTGSEIYRSFFGIDRLLPENLDEALFRYASLAGFPGRTDEEDEEVKRLLKYLEAHQAHPGWEPVAREAAPAKKKVKLPAARKKSAPPKSRK